MRKLLLLYVLLFLWALPAKTSLSLAMFPQEKLYVLSLEQQTPTGVWDGQLIFSALDKLAILLPSRFKIGMGEVSLSLGFTGFWQEYALLPLFAGEQALAFQGKQNAFVLFLPEIRRKKVIGYEHTMAKGRLSALAWMQPAKEPSSFQTEWGSEHSGWGVAGKVSLESSLLDLSVELLVTPVQGMEGFISSSCRYGSSKLGIAYGEETYPSRYSVSLDLKSRSLRATFMMEDWFGPKPIYGGFSAIRRRRQSSALRFSLGTGYLLFSFSDTYEFKQRGSEAGTVLMKATWKGFFGLVSAQYGEIRGPTNQKEGEFLLSLVLYKAALSYTEAGPEITLSDSVAIGKGLGTWKLKKSMGKAVTLTFMYAVTSGR